MMQSFSLQLEHSLIVSQMVRVCNLTVYFQLASCVFGIGATTGLLTLAVETRLWNQYRIYYRFMRKRTPSGAYGVIV